jgi:hypothetical protein
MTDGVSWTERRYVTGRVCVDRPARRIDDKDDGGAGGKIRVDLPGQPRL